MQFTEDLLTGLNDQQQAAVRHTKGPMLIMAGAGSGKTKTLTNRMAYLIQEKEVAPWNILAITFTNKAAREMKERVGHLVGADLSDRIWMSTFHAMCVRMLRRDGHRIGIQQSFTILDGSDQQSAIKQILKEQNIDRKKFTPRGMQGAISSAKNKLKTAGAFAKEAQDYYEQMVADVYQEYEKRLQANQSLDFDDLIMRTTHLLQRVPDVLEFYQRKFQYIHVDEYQDTNMAQYQLVNMLAERYQNLCVVGDSDQSIYRWRGADISNILSFEEDYPRAEVIKLEQNYRSTQTILDAANDVIAHNTSHRPKKLWTDHNEGEKIAYYRGFDEQDEARYIVRQMDRLSAEGYAYQKMAILYRTNAQSRALENALMKASIPYQIFGGTKFYDRKEIKDLLAYIRLIANPDDDLSFQRVINVPKRGIGASTVDKMAAFARSQGISLFRAAEEAREIGLSKSFVNKLQAFIEQVNHWVKMQEFLTVTELVEDILERSGYRKQYELEDSLESRSRLENIEEFLSVTKHFDDEQEQAETNANSADADQQTETAVAATAEETEDLAVDLSDQPALVKFLTELALEADIDQLNDGDEDETEDMVSLMTLHSAKGLEFPVVFLAGMEQNIFPHSRSIGEDEEMEEERRLCYVGMTRAEERLFLTNAKLRTMFGHTNSNEASCFLEEIPEVFLQEENKQTTSRSAAGSGPKRAMKMPLSQSAADIDWQVGDKVSHHKWGEGTVVSMKGEGEDCQLDIAFTSMGVKRLLAAIAPIEKIS